MSDTRVWAYCLKDGKQHGEIFASEADIPKGWVDSPEKLGKKDEMPAPDGREELVARYVEKFGKKPHHKLSEAKIAEALNGDAD